MSLERVSTGIDGLDAVVEGGFPRGSLVLVAGNPGTGKTVFSAQFIYRGAVDYGEKGVYVSFAEGKKSFIDYMRRFGMDFEKLEREGKIRILDMLTVKETAVSDVLNKVVEEVLSLKAKRLVIDSFSTLAQAFKEKIEARIILHTILGKIVKSTGCTTILIVEIPHGEEHMGLGIEEFVADGIIILKRGGGERDRMIREIEILKLRGTRIQQSTYPFTLEGGFHVLPLFNVVKPEKAERWKPIPDSETHFSTGNEDLDRVLDGGYERGSYVILEADTNVPLDAIRLFELPLILNFLSQNRGVAVMPAGGTSSDDIIKMIRPYIEEDVINRCLRIYEEVKPAKEQFKPYIALMRGGATNLERDAAAWAQVQINLMEATGKPVLTVVGYDTYESRYAEAPEKLFSEIGVQVTECKAHGNLTLAIARPGLSITRRALNMVDRHLKLIERNGSIFFYGVKPRTWLYHVNCHPTKGWPHMKLTPIV